MVEELGDGVVRVGLKGVAGEKVRIVFLLAPHRAMGGGDRLCVLDRRYAGRA